jgi:hypothetical protein
LACRENALYMAYKLKYDVYLSNYIRNETSHSCLSGFHIFVLDLWNKQILQNIHDMTNILGRKCKQSSV